MARARKPAAPRQAQVSNLQVGVPVPQNTSIKVSDLKSLSVKEIKDLLEKAKTAKVGYVILNAPFKIPPAEPFS